MVVMMPVGRSTRRMRSLCESATMRSPSGAIATPSGVSSCATIAGPLSPEKPVPRSWLPATGSIDVVARVDAADDVVVRVGDVDVAVRRDRDAARRVEPGLDRRTVVAGVALLLPPITGAGRRLAQHERAGAERHDHHDEDERAAQAVACAAATARSAAPAPALDGIATMPLPSVDPRDAAPDDRRRLRRAPERRRAIRATVSDDDNRAGERPAQRPTRRPRASRRQTAPASSRPPMPSAATMPNVVGRRCVLTRTQRLAAAVLLDQRADVEPRPAADEHADVAIVGPAFVDLDRAHRARTAQPVGQLRQHAIGRRPRLAPEAILGDAAGDQQQRAPRFGERRPRPAAGLRPGRAAPPPPAATARRGSGRARGRSGWMKCRYATVARYQSLLPGSESTSERIA